ncbi:MAG: alpha-ketoacid dehydrogenase subunit beta [Elusimicrobia bacterium]|nr:alpha-ketoacid dehydrogenase subunit beta [Elusimicrobiota bacterium]MBU2614632.1 alpha-ketoacid dehydrogenase subunit beta [Elusimicrobiota bacterium]
MHEVQYWKAINEALEEEMKRDPSVFVMGEDVAIYGGAYGVTRGLYEKFGEERVRDTAISEAAIVGAGLGAALTGTRPVVEIMYVDFMGIAMDQLNNQVAKIRYMFGGKCKVPLVVRTEGGAGRTLGAHHSQSLEAWFVHIPGIKVVMPATPYDAKGLLKSAIREDNPVMYIEHKMLYNTKGLIPETEYTVPIGKADVKKEGKDITVIAYSRSLLRSLEAAEELQKEGISCEVIDPRTLLPLDTDTILESVKKTHKVLIVHEACKTGGVGAEIGMKIMEEGFDYLDAPIKRLCGADVPMPKAPNLEKLAVPQKEDIIKAVKELI